MISGGETAGDGEIGDGDGAGAWDVSGTITPGDAVGSVTERLLNVCGACVVFFVVSLEVSRVDNELNNDAVVTAAGTLLTLAMPRMMSAVFVSKQPTYTPIVVFIGMAKHEFPGAQVVRI